MNIKYPYQSSDAEEYRGINKKMKKEMIPRIPGIPTGITVSYIEKFIVGDLFKFENENVSMHSKPQTNCPLCW